MEIKVEGHPDLVRDTKSGAIINNNTTEYNQYMESYKKRRIQRAKVDNMEEELSSLKEEIGEIKDLLRQLISK